MNATWHFHVILSFIFVLQTISPKCLVLIWCLQCTTLAYNAGVGGKLNVSPCDFDMFGFEMSSRSEIVDKLRGKAAAPSE